MADEFQSERRIYARGRLLPIQVTFLHHGGSIGLPTPARSAQELTDRERMMFSLGAKMRKLDQCAQILKARLDTTTNGAQYDRIALQLRETRGEHYLCEARYDAINRGLPFTALSRADELALLNAIRRVDQAIANSAAVTALLNAVHGLVQAFSASDTEA